MGIYLLDMFTVASRKVSSFAVFYGVALTSYIQLFTHCVVWLLARDLIKILCRDGMISSTWLSQRNCLSLWTQSLSPILLYLCFLLFHCLLLSVSVPHALCLLLSQEKGTGYHKEGQGDPLSDNMWKHCGSVSEVGVVNWTKICFLIKFYSWLSCVITIYFSLIIVSLRYG